MANYRGVVRIQGKPVEMDVEGSPAGRTLVRSGSTVLLNEKPFVAKEQFVFRVGVANVTLKWVQVGFGYECHVIGDDRVVLTSYDRAGVSRAPLSAAERERKKERFGSVVALGAGIVMILINSGVKIGGRYYPALLGMGPVLILAGLIGALRPDAVSSLKAGGTRLVVVLAVLAAAMVLSWLFFVPWYLELFTG
jgi:hypothetical protein